MRRKKTTEEFIAEARKVHGDKYDYSLVEYVDISTPVRRTWQGRFKKRESP